MVRIHPPSLTPSAPRIPASSARQDTTHRSRGSEVSAAATLSRPAAVGPGRRPARRAAPVSFSHAGRGLGGCSFPAPRSPWRRLPGHGARRTLILCWSTTVRSACSTALLVGSTPGWRTKIHLYPDESRATSIHYRSGMPHE